MSDINGGGTRTTLSIEDESQHQIFIWQDDLFNGQFGGWRRQGQCTFRIGRPRQRIRRFRFRFRGRPFVLLPPCRPLSVFVFRVTFGAVDSRVVRMGRRMWRTRYRSPIYSYNFIKWQFVIGQENAENCFFYKGKKNRFDLYLAILGGSSLVELVGDGKYSLGGGAAATVTPPPAVPGWPPTVSSLAHRANCCWAWINSSLEND